MTKEDIAHLFSAHGTASFRRMFGGTAIYVSGRIIGMELAGDLLLKGDLQTREAYELGGLKQWGYRHAKTDRQVMMPYWVVPPEAVDDHDRMDTWANLAWQAASRAK